MIINILLVALGGAIGSSSRYLISEMIFHYNRGSSFPLSTISINIAGSFLLGMLHFVIVNHMENISPNVRLFVMTGILSGFTTFSTFSLDTMRLLMAGQTTTAASYVILSVILSIVAIFMGFYLASLIAN